MRLKEGAELGVEVASNRKYGAGTRGNAALTVGWLGTPAQVRRLAPLLNDAAEIGAASDDGGIRRSQVRDIVLAALVAGSKQSLRDYGFGNRATFSGDSRLTAFGYFGFRDNEDRDKALARWKKWSDGSPPSGVPAP